MEYKMRDFWHEESNILEPGGLSSPVSLLNMSCNFTASFELVRGVTYSMFEKINEICPTTYIRPDPVSKQQAG